MIDIKNKNWRNAVRDVMTKKTSKTPETVPEPPNNQQDDNVNVNNINVPINIDLSCPDNVDSGKDDRINWLERSLEDCRQKNGDCERNLAKYYNIVSEATRFDQKSGSNNSEFLTQIKKSIDDLAEQSKKKPDSDAGSERVLKEVLIQIKNMIDSTPGDNTLEVKRLNKRIIELEEELSSEKNEKEK